MMPDVRIFWDPQGFEFDSLGNKEYLRTTDGDTPYISVSIRMLSIDAPEVHYPGSAHPSRQDDALAQLGAWLKEGKAPVDDGLAEYLYPRLTMVRAGTLQEHQGEQATAMFQQMLEHMLTKPGGGRRRLFVSTADLPFDQYGRLLAYIAPYYDKAERETLNEWERATFNLLMIKAGWAAPFPIYPSIPKHRDLVMLHDAAKEAFTSKRGIWAESQVLLGYEFRMVVKLYEVTRKLVAGETLSSAQRESWVERYCADMTTHEIFYPQDYYRVAPYDRLFIWPADVNEAVGRLNLISGS
jgi:endonuclease YncB( thermonuclease family)